MVLANGLLYPTECQIHVCETSSSIKVVFSEGCILGLPVYKVSDLNQFEDKNYVNELLCVLLIKDDAMCQVSI